jgi:hypothetical protein
MHSLLIIALILYLLSLSRSKVQFTIIDLSSKRLSSKLNTSIFNILTSRLFFIASLMIIILFSTYFDRCYRVRSFRLRARSCSNWTSFIRNIVWLYVQIFHSYNIWTHWFVRSMFDSLQEMTLMSEIEISTYLTDLEKILDLMIFDYSNYFSKLILILILRIHHDWHFWFCYLRLATSNRWIDRDERIRINRLFCKCLMLMFFVNLRTFYSSSFLKKLSRRKFSNRSLSAEILRRTCEILYSFLLVSIFCMSSKRLFFY